MAASGRKDLASANLIITEVLAKQDFNDQMTLNIKNPMVALFTFINCLSKLLNGQAGQSRRRGYLFPLFVLEDTLEATLHHRVFCDEAEKKHGQIDGQLRNEFQQTQFMEVMRMKWLLATNGGDEDQILIQLPPPAVTTNGWVKAIIVADTSIGIMGLTSVESMLLWN